ncbi:hypothetical protein KCP73_23765 [Salmonella enterica subsp. enterica]|nr:hypothetical protein KCP73_23765 [Salmonella enterica subsp. enterica]
MRFVYSSTRWRAYRCVLRAKGKDSVTYRLTRSPYGAEKEPEFARLTMLPAFPPASFAPPTAFANFAGRLHIRLSKSKRHKQAVEFTASAFKYRDGKLYMAKNKIPRGALEFAAVRAVYRHHLKMPQGGTFVSCSC